MLPASLACTAFSSSLLRSATFAHGIEGRGFDGELARPVLDAMVATVRTGEASDLTNAKGLRALVGTNGPDGPGWFLGIIDKKVIVVYCEGERSGTAALQAAQKYLKVRNDRME